MSAHAFPVAVLAPGHAEGDLLALREPVSFWGGFDAGSGLIVDHWHPDRGLCLSGRILIMRSARGSSSGSSVLAEAIRVGTAPAAIVLRARDSILTIGALVAGALYERHCPVVVVEDDGIFASLATGQHGIVQAEGPVGTLRFAAAVGSRKA
jgi:predicted aconitase with swiveling domain